MNTDMAQICRVLRSLLAAADKGKMTKGDKDLCAALLSSIEEKYGAGVAALDAAAVVLAVDAES